MSNIINPSQKYQNKEEIDFRLSGWKRKIEISLNARTSYKSGKNKNDTSEIGARSSN